MAPHRDPYDARDDDRDDDRDPSQARAAATRPFLRGVGAAIAVDTLVNVPHGLFLPLMRAQNFSAAIDTLLFGFNIAVGYVGGRSATRAGLAHDDARSHWNMAWATTLLSLVISYATLRAGMHWPRLAAVLTRAAQSANQTSTGAMLAQIFFMLLLVRFGFAIGAFAQAKREGRIAESHDA